MNLEEYLINKGCDASIALAITLAYIGGGLPGVEKFLKKQGEDVEKHLNFVMSFLKERGINK
jgi:ferritin